MDKGRRVLGAQRQVEEVIPSSSVDANTNFHVGDDTLILMDEVLNNSTRAVLVFDDFSDRFTDFEMYQLSKAFKFNKTIVALTMSGVNVGDDGVSLLCQSLVQSNIQYIDLTNTPLDDEAGSSLAALARCNRNLRTVIVTDTLISEEILDEIDLACQINESTGDPDPLAPIHSGEDPKWCVAHLFDACPNGAYCVFSHNLPGTGSADQRQLEADWEKALPPPPREGATWRNDSDEPRQLRIDLSKVRRTATTTATEGGEAAINGSTTTKREKKGGASSKAGKQRQKSQPNRDAWVVGGAVVVAAAVITIAVLITGRRQ